MKISVLCENTARDGFLAEHGLSLYIETAQHRILFDMGQSDVFVKNAERLGIDLRAVDIAVLSHGHYDHGGGIRHFLSRNGHAPIYLSRHAFGPHHNAAGKYIGLDPDLPRERLRAVDGELQIDGALSLFSYNDRSQIRPIEAFGLHTSDENGPRSELFLHEQYLLIQEEGQRVLISGCSHKGIENIVSWAQPDVLIGGFHFMRLPVPSPRLEEAAQMLLSYPTRYYTGHCTGSSQFDYLKTIMGSRLEGFHAGDTFPFGYRYETHCHCSECSACAHSTSAELVRAYHAAGYAGLVLTDHFVLGNTAVDRTLPWETQMRCYYGAFLEAKAAAQDLDFDVIFGIEHACQGSEFLCYGIDLDFLLANPDIPALPLDAFVERVHRHGGIVIQAHPFRWAPAHTPLRLDILNGIEVYNAANHPDANKNARDAARKGLILTSGGDIHIASDHRIGMAGIVLPHRISDSRQLAHALQQRTHHLLVD